MKAPQIIVIILIALTLLLNAYMHGKPKTGKYNFWTSLISEAITFFLLYWGGFFTN